MKMLMKIALPKMEELLVMMMMMISPSGREVPPVESLHRRAKVLLPNFCLETAALCPKVLSLFFLGQNDLYTRTGAPEFTHNMEASHKEGEFRQLEIWTWKSYVRPPILHNSKQGKTSQRFLWII